MGIFYSYVSCKQTSWLHHLQDKCILYIIESILCILVQVFSQRDVINNNDFPILYAKELAKPVLFIVVASALIKNDWPQPF